MRFFCLLCAALVLGCGKPYQALTSPCVGQPATAVGEACPPCATDGDCKLLSNMCEAQAYCVHNNSNWTVTPPFTCADPYPATMMPCRCVDNICTWAWR